MFSTCMILVGSLETVEFLSIIHVSCMYIERERWDSFRSSKELLITITHSFFLHGKENKYRVDCGSGQQIIIMFLRERKNVVYMYHMSSMYKSFGPVDF